MTLNGAYSWSGDVNTQGRRGYASSPAEPAFLLEEPYDEEGPDGSDDNPGATQPVRRFQWWGWLSTIEGYVSGNAYIWPFTPGVWQQHLSTQGAKDMSNLNAFIRSIAWEQLVPDGFGPKDLVTAGLGSQDELGQSGDGESARGRQGRRRAWPRRDGAADPRGRASGENG